MKLGGFKMLKRKINTAIFFVALSVLALVVGVFAASQASVSVNGLVKYTSLGNVKATISLSHTASNEVFAVTENGEGTAVGGEVATITFAGTEKRASGSFDLTGTADGTVLALSAVEGADEVSYSYTLTVVNNYTAQDSGEKKNLKVTFTPPGSNSAVTTNFQTGYTWTNNSTILTTGASVEIVVTFLVNDLNNTVEANLASSIALEATGETGQDFSPITLNLNTNGGSLAENTAKVYTGSTYGELPVPTRLNYNFIGWYTGENGTGIKITSTTVVNKTYTTLYAHWEINQFDVTLNKGTGIASISGAGQYTPGTSVTISATPASGYVFKDWTGYATATTISYTFTMPSQNVTFTANGKASLTSITTTYTTATAFEATINTAGTETTTTLEHIKSKALALTTCTYSDGSTKTGSQALSAGDITITTDKSGTDFSTDTTVTIKSADNSITKTIKYTYNPGKLGTYATPFAKDANNNYPYYIRMGAYSGYAIDWIVLGGCTAEAYTEANATIFSQTTAGVKSGWSYNENVGFLIGSTKAETLLLISQYTLMNYAFDSSYSTYEFYNSGIRTYMNGNNNTGGEMISAIGFSSFMSYIANTAIPKTGYYEADDIEYIQSTGNGKDITAIKFFLLGLNATNRVTDDSFGVFTYFGERMGCWTTPSGTYYHGAKNIKDPTGSNDDWWLRSGEYTTGGQYFAFYVYSSGMVDSDIVSNASEAVRPAFTLNI